MFASTPLYRKHLRAKYTSASEFRVNVTPRAERDFALLLDAINAAYSATARKWYMGLREAIFSLERQPNRCPETPENSKLRHLLYGRRPHVYRVIYRVIESSKQVDILHIRHGARQKFKRSEVNYR
ncbi:MAG: type II toxin-antitoxin system RelE/ParE family toxin [Bryobacterales bacterium]|nr:type II toxin-antitoxin system RelE/ParE family toxin [Bryobacterales bacterium]